MTLPASSSWPRPVPIATIDSPSAMITISENRSAKWAGDTRKPRTPKMYGPRKSVERASTQTTSRAGLSRKAAPIRSSGAGSAVRDSRRMASPASTSSLASAKMKMWSQRAAAYAMANSSAWSPNASGTASAATRKAPITASIRSRSRSSSAAM